MLFKKCGHCDRNLLFGKKYELDGITYCSDCHIIVSSEKIKQQQERSEQEKIEEEKRLQIKKEQHEKADVLLKEQLEQEKLGEKRKEERRLEKEQLKEQQKKEKEMLDEAEEEYIPCQTIHIADTFSKEELDRYDRLLLVEASVKRVKATEWLNGKKRVVLNKEREIRRTHAGGYSAEKFQKFVDFKKRETVPWITNSLERPGVLRGPYDKIKVISESDDLQAALEGFLEKFSV